MHPTTSVSVPVPLSGLLGEGQRGGGTPRAMRSVGGNWAVVVRGSQASAALGGVASPAGNMAMGMAHGRGPGFIPANQVPLSAAEPANSDSRMPMDVFRHMWPDHKLPPRVNFRMGLALITKVDCKFYLWTPAEALAVKFPTWGVEFEQLQEVTPSGLEAYCHGKLDRMLRYDFPFLKNSLADRRAILQSLSIKWVLHQEGSGGLQGQFIGFGCVPSKGFWTKATEGKWTALECLTDEIGPHPARRNILELSTRTIWQAFHADWLLASRQEQGHPKESGCSTSLSGVPGRPTGGTGAVGSVPRDRGKTQVGERITGEKPTNQAVAPVPAIRVVLPLTQKSALAAVSTPAPALEMGTRPGTVGAQASGSGGSSGASRVGRGRKSDQGPTPSTQAGTAVTSGVDASAPEPRDVPMVDREIIGLLRAETS